MDCWL